MPRKKLVKSGIETKHGGDRSQTIKDSNDVVQADISGSGNIVNIGQLSKADSFNIRINEVANGYMVLCRHLLKYLGISKFHVAIIISFITSGYLSIDMFTVKILPQNIYITAFGFIWLGMTLSIFGLYSKRTCKKCGQKFAYREIKATHLGGGEYRGRRYHTLRLHYKCDFCGYEDVRKVVDSEEIQNSGF